MKPKLYLLAVGLCAVCLFAASPTLINRNSQWPPQGNSFGFGGPYEFISQLMPTGSTVVTAKTAHIIGIWLHNPTGGSSITVTIKDAQGTPQPLPLDGQVITAGTDVVFNAPFGVLASGGITVQASGSGLTYQVQFTN